MARKKPTMKETVGVINQIIREVTALRADVTALTGVIDAYIELSGDVDKFNDFINKKLNVGENNDVRKNETSSAVTAEGSP